MGNEDDVDAFVHQKIDVEYIEEALEQCGYYTHNPDTVWFRKPFSASSNDSNERVAVIAIDKKLHLLKKNKTFQDSVDKELEIANLLNHVNIVKTLLVYQNPFVACIIMEKLNIQLCAYLTQKGPFTEDEAKRLFLQLARAVNYMHDTVNIAHGNITCSSILLDDTLNLKLGDFSLSRQFEHLNPNYMVWAFNKEELDFDDITKNAVNMVKGDVWGMGLVLFFMLCAKYPPRTANFVADKEEMDKLSISPNCHHLLSSLLDKQPSVHLTSKCILSHDWLKVETTTAATTSDVETFLVETKSLIPN